MSELFHMKNRMPPPFSIGENPHPPEGREIALDLPCDTSGLSVARRELEAFLDGSDFNDVQRSDLQLAMGEAIANAIRHGCPGGKTVGRIRVQAALTPEGIAVDVTDPGPGFDSSVLPEPDVTLLREGGMGVFLMRAVMDSVEYRWDERGNTVRMVKSKR